MGKSPKAQKCILAIASAGGHWQQLMLLRPAFADHNVHYMNTLEGLAQQFEVYPTYVVPDCNRNTPFVAIRSILAIGYRVLVLRPDIIVSTGALPGVIALAFGRLIKARTIWVDSVANAEEMSASGKLARRFADLWVSQWPDVAQDAGADYAGALL